MAMEGPGCVMSREPLTPPGDDAVDAALLGDWAYQGDPSGELAVRVALRDRETMEFWWRLDGARYLILAGHLSTAGGRSYANLQFVDADCIDCSEDARAAFKREFAADYATIVPTNPDNACTWVIFSYRHDEDGTLRYATFDGNRVLEAIAAGSLAGTDGESAEPGSYDEICITAPARALRRFIQDASVDLFEPEYDVLVRRTADDR
jgi:hypothetical protein